MTTLGGAISARGRAFLAGEGSDEARTGDGPRAAGIEFTRWPAADVAGGRVVISSGESDVAYPDLSNPAHADLLLGITAFDVAGGSELAVVAAGEMREPGWSWAPGPVFCGVDGQLVQAVPAVGWVRQVGLALACDRILVDTRANQQGAQGSPGLGAMLQRFAAIPMSGQLVVRDAGAGTCQPADPANPGDAHNVLGILTAAINAPANVSIQALGDMSDPSWDWTPGLPLFCGPSGSLTQAPPSAGWLMRVGVAVSPTAIVIGLQPPIQLI